MVEVSRKPKEEKTHDFLKELAFSDSFLSLICHLTSEDIKHHFSQIQTKHNSLSLEQVNRT